MLVQRNYELKQSDIQFAFQQQLKEKKNILHLGELKSSRNRA